MKSSHSPLSLLAAAALLTGQFPVLANELPLYCKYPPGRGLTPDQEASCAQDPAAAADQPSQRTDFANRLHKDRRLL